MGGLNTILKKKLKKKLKEINTPTYANFPLQKSYFISSPILDKLICNYCKCIPNKPVELLTCRHLLCMSCILSVCENGPLSCMCNNKIVNPHELCEPSHITLDILGSSLIRCNQTCGEIMELHQFMSHLESGCCSEVQVPSPSKLSVRQFLDLQQDQAPSQLQLFTKGILVDSIVPAAGSITCRSATGKVNLITDNTKKWHCLLCLASITGGVTTPRVDSSTASTRTLKRRSTEMEQVRDIVSKGASVKQLQFEVKNLTREEREAILHSIPEAAITIPPEQILAMKADLSIPWKVGLGFLGEQGAESVHAQFNSIRKNYVNIPSRLKQLEAIMKEHFCQICPDNIVRQPLPEKRGPYKKRSQLKLTSILQLHIQV